MSFLARYPWLTVAVWLVVTMEFGVGETWEVASSVSVGFLIQTQNKTKVLGVAGRKLPGLPAEMQF